VIPEPAIARSAPKAHGGWLGIFRPAPPLPVTLADPVQVAARCRSWQWRVLVLSTLGYAAFYFVRANLPVAFPYMSKDIGITKEQFGTFLTLQGVVYGISKFANGFLADRANACVFMSVALLASALLNLCFGVSSVVIALGLLWMFNGWFQGMGFPPCARLMANWFPPKQFATKFSVWNTSHNIGSIGILLLCGFLVSGIWFPANWRLCFFIPAVIAIVMAIILWSLLPDTPPSVGLPEFEGTQVELPGKKSHEDFKAFVFQQVFRNPYIWALSAANFFVYALRYAVFNWGPTMLLETRHIKILHAAAMLSGFEAFGALGAILGGWMTHRFFGERAARTCVIYMALAGISILLFWRVQTQSEWLMTGLLCATGFFIYGPQCLLAIACVNLATRRAAATAVGLTSIFGYASTTLSGWGLGFLVQHYGWNAAFGVLVGCAALGTMLFLIAWPAKAHGYKE
jgi:sugar phosphate permease